MGNIGDTISDSAPAVSTAGPGYATTINALLTEFKTRLVAKIPLSSLLTNSNLDMNGQAILNAAYLTLVNEAVSPVASPVNRFASYQGNAYWISPSGPVQITSGATLNAAGIGGITGDYSGAGPMEFRYDLANTRYDAFSDQSANEWAYVRGLGFDIAGDLDSAFRFRQLYNGTSNVDVTWSEVGGPVSGKNILTIDSSDVIESTEAIDQFVNTYHTSKYIVLTAIDLFRLGYFSGAGVAAIASSSDVFRYNMSLAGGVVDIPIQIPNEGSSVLTQNPISIKSIQWKGLINGGGYPTLEIFRNKGTATFDVSAQGASSMTLNAIVTSSGATQRAARTCNPAFNITGDQFIVARMTAGTNNLDTYYLIIEYDKQS